MDQTPFSIGSIYLAGFAQARAPHVGILIPTSHSTGTLVHIRIDPSTSPNWVFQYREQKIEGDMFLTSLLKIGGPPAAGTEIPLRSVAETIPAPQNNTFGECFPWAMGVVNKLHELGLICVKDIDSLEKEFSAFVAGNRAYARRDKFPNVAVSQFVSF